MSPSSRINNGGSDNFSRYLRDESGSGQTVVGTMAESITDFAESLEELKQWNLKLADVRWTSEPIQRRLDNTLIPPKVPGMPLPSINEVLERTHEMVKRFDSALNPRKKLPTDTDAEKLLRDFLSYSADMGRFSWRLKQDLEASPLNEVTHLIGGESAEKSVKKAYYLADSMNTKAFTVLKMKEAFDAGAKSRVQSL